VSRLDTARLPWHDVDPVGFSYAPCPKATSTTSSRRRVGLHRPPYVAMWLASDCRRRRRGPQVRQERGRADGSIARSAPLGAAAPLPRGGMTRANPPSEERGGTWVTGVGITVGVEALAGGDPGRTGRAAELASQAARAEGASPPTTTASRRGLRRWQRVSGRRRSPPAPGPARVLGWSGRCGWHGRPGGAGRAVGGRPGGGGGAGRGG
jgi:hypothetical protein